MALFSIAKKIKKLKESIGKNKSYFNFQNKLHILYKNNMIEKNISGFVSNFKCGSYLINEADPFAKIAIEIDSHKYSMYSKIYKIKSTYLKNKGWLILRFKEHEIKRNPYVGIDMIKDFQSKRREAHKNLLKNSFLSGNLKVKSMVKNSLEPEWKPLKDVVKHYTPHKKIIKISTELGPINVTEDHSLFNWEDKNPVRASDLKEGDLIVGAPDNMFEPIKILKTEIIESEENTYDVSVPETENALLDSGILVHNTYSIGGVSLDIEKSSKYQSMKDEYIGEYDKLVEANKRSIKIIKGLQQPRYGIGITSALGPLNQPGCQSRRNMISPGQGYL